MKNSITLCGFMGCGKSTIGKLLAEKLNMTFIDTDDYVRELAGKSIHDMLVEGDLPAVRAWEKQAVAELSARAKAEGLVIATGAGVCADTDNGKVFHDCGKLIYIKRDFHRIFPEISNDPVRVMAYRKSFEELKELHDGRIPKYSKYADLIVNNDGEPQECADQIIRGL